MLAAQKEMDTVTKDATNPHFKSTYASLASVLDMVRPALNRHGIVILQPSSAKREGEYGQLESTINLIHAETGYMEEFPCDMLLTAKLSPQDQGSAISYNRRYSLMSLFCIPTEDDDGNAATKASEETRLAELFLKAVEAGDLEKLITLEKRLPSQPMSEKLKKELFSAIEKRRAKLTEGKK